MKQFPVAIILERTRLDNRWVSEKWEVVGVVPAFDGGSERTPRRIFADARREQFRVDGFALELFRDQAEDYFLNLSAPTPKVFVMWRLEDDLARPCCVTVSYGEAARLLDSGEQVDGVVMPPEIADWVGDFVNTHYTPAPRKKVRRNDPFAAGKDGGKP